jgi:hypothetical protein
MHRLQRPNLAWKQNRWWRATVLAAAVMVAHALLLQLATPAPSRAPARAPSIELRPVRVAAPTVGPADAAGVAAAPAPPPPRRAARPSKPETARNEEPARTEAQATRNATSVARTAPQAPTRVPPSTDLVFALQHGSQVGAARLTWRADGGRYALSLHATLPSGRLLEQHSEGGFDAAGLAPLRLADRRHGRDVRAANFQREHGKITFSGPRWELPLEAGTQDRLSWLLQLVALIGGATHGLRDGTELAMWVVGARGAASHWRFEVRGQQPIELDGQRLDAWWLVREPAHPYDLRVEVWLGAQQGHWPLMLRQTQIPGGEPLEWRLRLQPPRGRSEPDAPLEPGT